MKKEIIFLVFLVLVSLIQPVLAQDSDSLDFVINKKPNEVYNLDDTLKIAATIINTDSGTLQEQLTLYLICEGKTIEFHQGFVELGGGEEIEKELLGFLTEDFIGNTKGRCKAKISLGEEYKILNDEFRISDSVDVKVNEISDEIEPGKNIIIEGNAIKENGEGVNGFVDTKLGIGNDSIETQRVREGFFKINTTIPEKTAAEEYKGTVNVYEKSDGEKTNTGEADFKFSVSQVPSNLEIIIEEDEIKPEGEAKIKSVLHDQTGENIPKPSTITITNPEGIIVKKENKETGKLLDFELEKNALPGKWNVSAISEGMTTESDFSVLDNKETEVELVNNTVFIENVGNVYYNDSVSVKIGNDTVDVPTSLDLGETKKYYLEAPEGNYTVEVMAGGEKKIQQNVQLTGKAISIKETLSGNLIKNPIVWGFVIILLGIILYMVFRKGYKRSFIGRKIHHKKKKKNSHESSKKESGGKSKEKKDKATEAMNQGILPSYENKAGLSLSIKGNKQNANLICLKINNYDEVKNNPEGVKETLQKIVKTSERNKAYIYETNDNIFFIFAPEITKTFKNEKNTIQTAIKIESELRNHNKYFKQKINFGLSVNRGEIVVKKEKKVLQFMSVGKLTTLAKKLASISKGETLLTKEINEKLSPEIRTEKGEDKENKIEFYRVKEIKDRSHNQKFLKEFVKRYKEDENKGKEKKE